MWAQVADQTISLKMVQIGQWPMDQDITAGLVQ